MLLKKFLSFEILVLTIIVFNELGLFVLWEIESEYVKVFIWLNLWVNLKLFEVENEILVTY